MDFQIRIARQLEPGDGFHLFSERGEAVEGDTRKCMVGGVIGHVPVYPMHETIGSQRSRIQ